MPKGSFPKPKGENSPHFVHGASIRDSKNRREPIYIAWVNMRQRCRNKNKWDYKFYGGRGIDYCQRWELYKNFLRDMGSSYYAHKKENSSTTLERIDINGNYSKQNCKWATRAEQVHNRSNSAFIYYLGFKWHTVTMAKYLKINIRPKELYKRIITRGWGIERAITQPVRKIRTNRIEV